MHAIVVSPENETLASKDVSVDAAANVTAPLFMLPVTDLFEKHPLVFVRLELRDAKGAMIADNFYWIAKDPAENRGLDKLANASVNSSIQASADGRSTAEKKTYGTFTCATTAAMQRSR